MIAPLMYCMSTNNLKPALRTPYENQSIAKAFELLSTELKKMDLLMQRKLNAIITQFLKCLIKDPNDSIHHVKVFVVQYDFIIDAKPQTIKTIGRALGVITLSLAGVLIGAALGMGIGMLLGLWQTPLMFMASLLAAHTAPLIVATSGIATGIGVGLWSQFMLFKKPQIKPVLDNYVAAIQQDYLSTISLEEGRQEAIHGVSIIDETENAAPSIH